MRGSRIRTWLGLPAFALVAWMATVPFAAAQQPPALAAITDAAERTRVQALIEGARKEGALSWIGVQIEPGHADPTLAERSPLIGDPRRGFVRRGLINLAARFHHEVLHYHAPLGCRQPAHRMHNPTAPSAGAVSIEDHFSFLRRGARHELELLSERFIGFDRIVERERKIARLRGIVLRDAAKRRREFVRRHVHRCELRRGGSG